MPDLRRRADINIDRERRNGDGSTCGLINVRMDVRLSKAVEVKGDGTAIFRTDQQEKLRRYQGHAHTPAAV